MNAVYFFEASLVS